MSFEISNLFSVAGKTAIVTGGSRGIGRMIAQGYVENGVKTYISARKAEACIATAEELSEKGECIAFPADLSTKEGRDAFIGEITEREDKIDILVIKFIKSIFFNCLSNFFHKLLIKKYII